MPWSYIIQSHKIILTQFVKWGSECGQICASKNRSMFQSGAGVLCSKLLSIYSYGGWDMFYPERFWFFYLIAASPLVQNLIWLKTCGRVIWTLPLPLLKTLEISGMVWSRLWSTRSSGQYLYLQNYVYLSICPVLFWPEAGRALVFFLVFLDQRWEFWKRLGVPMRPCARCPIPYAGAGS